MLIRITLHNFVVFVAKHFWVFISYTVHRNRLIDMFINHINGVINKNLSLLFFPSDVKLAWKAKQKQRELTKNQLFFISLFFFSKNSGYKEIKSTNFWKGIAYIFLGQVLTNFQTGSAVLSSIIFSLALFWTVKCYQFLFLLLGGNCSKEVDL